MLLDTYAWIELFKGSQKGKKVYKILKEKECFTSIISISEIVVYCLRNDINFEDRVKRIKNLSRVLPLDESIVELAGIINYKEKIKIKDFGMIDSLIYATAQFYNLEILTGDRHFVNLSKVRML